MKIYFILVSFILWVGYAFNQKGVKPISLKKIQGTYKGWTSQTFPEGAEAYYKTVFKIKVGKNNTVKGQSTFYDALDSTQVLVIYNFEGTYDASSQLLKLKEYEVVQKSKDWTFCFKEMPMQCVIENRKIELRGTWTARNCPNTNGKIRVIKNKP